MSETPTSEAILQQSLELNKIQADLLKERGKNQRAPWIALIVVTVAMVAIVISLLLFFNQYEFYTETVEVTQDTADGGGNNNYFAKEGNTYNESTKGSAVNGDASS